MIVTLRFGVLKCCPFRDEQDVGRMIITIPGRAPELHELGDKVAALTAEPISHEDFTSAVGELLPKGSTVTTHWQTGPWQVEVRVG